MISLSMRKETIAFILNGVNVKTLTGSECTMCAKRVLWVQGDQWNSLWMQGALAKSKSQWFNGRDKWGVWDWSQDVNKYRTSEYHYN